MTMADNIPPIGTTWRYQPVWVDHNGLREYTLCEVYLGDDGALTAWTESPSITPSGYDLSELTADIEHMARDAAAWEPIAFTDLHLGMTFTSSVLRDRHPEIRRRTDALSDMDSTPSP